MKVNLLYLKCLLLPAAAVSCSVPSIDVRLIKGTGGVGGSSSDVHQGGTSTSGFTGLTSTGGRSSSTSLGGEANWAGASASGGASVASANYGVGGTTVGNTSFGGVNATGGLGPFCGDGLCSSGETNINCCQDCGCATANSICQRSSSGCVTPLAITAGGFHTCAWMQDGTISCWGGNGFGECGVDSGGQDVRHPIRVQGVSAAKAVAAGGTFTCAILVTNNVATAWCWGDNSKGQLGNGATTTSSVPVQVQGLSNVTAIAAGYDYACARTTDSNVWCWGNNSMGQLGSAKAEFSSTPVAVQGLMNASNGISAGYDYVCSILNDASLVCWGDNYHGQLGCGTTVSAWTPQKVLDLTIGVRSIAAGSSFAPGETPYTHVEGTVCAILNDGTGRCWGSYQDGALGVPETDATRDATVPATVTNLTNASSIVAGYFFACAITNNNDIVRCWGYGQDGELGNGVATVSWTPLDVSNLTGVNAIAAGAFHACALLNINEIKCWGSNGHGQIGTNSTSAEYLRPVDVNW